MHNVPDFQFPFDFAAVSNDMRERFGWTESDFKSAMAQLLPAAAVGLQRFGYSAPVLKPFLELAFQPLAMPNAFAPASSGAGLDAVSPVFGPDFVQKALAKQIATMTGLQQDAIAEMMPVAATLAMGQLTKPYLQGEARELLDAFMRGYARGRPAAAPSPMDYITGYTDAMQAFWSGFLSTPSDAGPELREEDSPVPDNEKAETPADMTGESGERQDASEFETMILDWMAVGRDIQSSQFQAFDKLFEQSLRDEENG